MTYGDDVSIAANAADWVGCGSGERLLFLPTLVFLLRGFIALIRTGVALGFNRVGHHVDQALKRRAEFPLFIFFEAIVQSFVDHDT